jgi:hypothetical protein
MTLTTLTATACSSAVSIENADVPAWKATTLPTADRIVLEDSGKILNRDALTKESPDVPRGTYTLTMTCDGGGKAFFSVTQSGTEIADGGAACNGSLERLKVTVPESGSVQISTSSVDAPLLYAYHLAAAS